ncbi:hypothetical protein AN958_00065 [Leucoagaricus sp. SymC.cos]|nr:hypothetical protein AN958_00065 [Leucoagaricus sp. SymC.cos]
MKACMKQVDIAHPARQRSKILEELWVCKSCNPPLVVRGDNLVRSFLCMLTKAHQGC